MLAASEAVSSFVRSPSAPEILLSKNSSRSSSMSSSTLNSSFVLGSSVLSSEGFWLTFLPRSDNVDTVFFAPAFVVVNSAAAGAVLVAAGDFFSLDVWEGSEARC